MKAFQFSSKVRLCAFVTIAPLMALSQSAWATSEVQKLFIKHYPNAEGTKLDSCATCHSPNIKDMFNNYGLLLKVTQLDFANAEAKDSDGDGKTNGEEILAESFPGSQAADEGLFVFTTMMGPITFKHGEHVVEERFGINGNCDTCHDSSKPKFFPKLFDDKTSMQDTGHAICMNCHNSDANKVAPTGCPGCHGK